MFLLVYTSRYGIVSSLNLSFCWSVPPFLDFRLGFFMKSEKVVVWE